LILSSYLIHSTICPGAGEVFLTVNAIVRYAQDYTTCRKILFEKYFFLDSGHLQQQDTVLDDDSHLVNQVTPDVPCGTCDNCQRDQSQVAVDNIANETATLVVILRALQQRNERVTMNQLISIWKGKGLKSLHLEHLKKNGNISFPVDSKYTIAVMGGPKKKKGVNTYALVNAAFGI
jgi:ATP-dependent DNA helicase Q1